MKTKRLSFTATVLTSTLFLLSTVNVVSAKEIAIYRWVDKNNVVHFSQNLPKGDEYREFSTISSYKALSKAERKLIAEQSNAEQKITDQEKQQDNVIAQNKATYKKNCKAARLNIKMLNSLNDVHINEENSDGTIGSRPLTAPEKANKLALSKKHEELYCNE